ncbi:MAG TPA: hypothetical protein VFI00_12760 [Kribbella sp.]|nr:hypothetical protein [Kribbella sp.]
MLAIDLAFLRDLSAAQTKGGQRAAQRQVDALSPACAGEGIPAPSAPELEEGGEHGYADRAPLRRIAGFTKDVSGYVH